MTCHDREIMNRVVGKIVEIDGGELRTYTGNYDFYEKMRVEETVPDKVIVLLTHELLAGLVSVTAGGVAPVAAGGTDRGRERAGCDRDRSPR